MINWQVDQLCAEAKAADSSPDAQCQADILAVSAADVNIFSSCLIFFLQSKQHTAMFLTSFKFQSPRSSTASGWIFLNWGCKLPVSFRIYLCQRPNPAILWWLWQSGAIVDRLRWNDKWIYWNHLKHLNASKKLESRLGNIGNRIRWSDSDFSNPIQKFSNPTSYRGLQYVQYIFSW